jgi:hypothetical protein
MADVDACFNTAESAETPLQLNIAAAEINSLDVLITEVLKNIEEEKFRAKIQPKPKQDGSLLGPLPSSVSDSGNNAPFGIED